MGHRKKQMDIEDAVAASKNGHNGGSELTEDERHALHLNHCRDYELKLGAKKKADAELKNCGKRIKAEGDSVAKVKKTLKARSPEGEAEIRAEMLETLEVLRWSGVEVGESADLFPTDRVPSEDRAFAEGKRAGLNAEARTPPHDPSVPQYHKWMEGYDAGQAVLASGFMDKMKTEDVAADLPHVDTSDAPFHAPDAEPATAH